MYWTENGRVNLAKHIVFTNLHILGCHSSRNDSQDQLCNTMVPKQITQCNTMQFNAVQYNTIQYNAVHYNTMQYNIYYNPGNIT